MEYLKSATSFLDKAMKLANEINLPIQKACIYYDYASIAFHKKEPQTYHKICLGLYPSQDNKIY